MLKCKNVLMVCVLTLMLCVSGCKPGTSVVGPVVDTGATFEILYERVLPIVNPSGSDPTGGWTLFLHPEYGGLQSTFWEKVEGTDNKWQAERYLEYSRTKYVVWGQDLKVAPEGDGIAQNYYMRKKGQSEWQLLTSIKENAYQKGKMAEFIADNTGIHNPNSSGNF